MSGNFVYLASASPRRRELLEQIGVAFELRPVEIDERRVPNESATEYVRRVATAKAGECWNGLRRDGVEHPVLAADTAVALGGEVFGKPADRSQALDTLAALSGRTHTVATGVAVRFGEELQTALSVSEVTFRATTAQERDSYLGTDEPLDKAGGYAIQGFGAVFIEDLRGSYSAVMGLPLYETAMLLRRFGIPRWLNAAGHGP